MTAQLNLKEIERKAYRSTYQDGLMDIYLGLVVIAMSVFMYHPAGGYSPLNIFLWVLIFLLAQGLFWAGKKYITLPRMGQVRFGPVRKQKNRTLALVLGVLVALQVLLLGMTTLGWLSPETAGRVNEFLASRNLMDAAVAAIGALIVGVSLTLMAFFNDFPRGYYIALLASLATFLMIYLNQPLYPIILGMLILIPGVVLFVRFLREYPLRTEPSYER